MSGARDPYKVLQVDPEADPEVIQAAYRRLAQKYHPDLAGAAGSPEHVEASRKMVALNAAWEVIGDPTRRAAHDETRVGAGAAAAEAHRRAPASGPAAERRPVAQQFDPGQVAFGRYAGWRIEQILRVDPGYLEWLDRTPAGRPYREEIDAQLRKVGRRSRGIEGTAGLPRR